MAIEAAIFGGISALSQIVNAFTQSSAIRAQSRYENSIAQANARMAAFQAEDAERRGRVEASRLLRQTKGLIGKQRAAFAGQGIELDSGSALDIQEETAALGAADALTIRNNAWREAFGYRAQGSQYLAQARLGRRVASSQARNTLLMGGLSAAREVGSLAYNDYLNRPRG